MTSQVCWTRVWLFFGVVVLSGAACVNIPPDSEETTNSPVADDTEVPREDPKVAEYYELGTAKLAAGDAASAYTYFRAVVARDPDYRDTAEILARPELEAIRKRGVERRAKDQSAVRSSRPSQPPPVKRPVSPWYRGGTLHDKGALDWQVASNANKLATCGDFVTSMWRKRDLRPSIARRISSVEDVRPLARELVTFLDAAFEKDADPRMNRVLYANQEVASTAAIGMVMMGWTND